MYVPVGRGRKRELCRVWGELFLVVWDTRLVGSRSRAGPHRAPRGRNTPELHRHNPRLGQPSLLSWSAAPPGAKPQRGPRVAVNLDAAAWRTRFENAGPNRLTKSRTYEIQSSFALRSHLGCHRPKRPFGIARWTASLTAIVRGTQVARTRAENPAK